MKGMKKLVRKGIAMLIACAMLAPSLPTIAMADDDKLVLHYDFESLENGTIVNDVSGNGLAGVVRPTGSGVEIKEVSILGETKTAFVMNGGQPDGTHPYVELPQGILNGLEDATISCWVYVDADNANYQRIWDFGSGTTSYMYLLADGRNDGFYGYTTAITNNGWQSEKGPQKNADLATGKWIYTTVTFDGSEKALSLYENGELIGTATTDADLSVLQGSTQNYIGYGQWENDILDGMVADFKIYNYAMSAEEIAAVVALSDEERVEIDTNDLTLGDISAVTANLKLPAEGGAGSAITWATSDASVITADGKITRPAADAADATATLTATITYGDITSTKTFEVTVKREMNAAEIAQADADAIDLGNLAAVKADLVLPTTGAMGSTITWASSNEAVISATGAVKRPSGADAKVTLTATVTNGDQTVTKEFTATVLANFTQIKIVSVEDVAVTSYKGKLPSLPATVTATYDNGKTGEEKVTWPTNLKISDFSAAGEKTVTGRLVSDDSITIAAKVTITDAVQQGPVKVAESFHLSDISLDGTNTIYGQNAARAYEYLKVMNADRMLYNFRATFGQDTKGVRALTGWDEPTGLLRGHSTGHFMSALAIAYASTGDVEYKEKLDYMITEMRKLQLLSEGDASEFKTACNPNNANQNLWSKDPSTWGKGFISAYSPDQFALLEQYTPYATIWAPYYTLHKLFAGFLDSYTYAGNEEGLEIAKDLGLWVHDRLSACTPEQRTNMWAMYIAGEYGGMNEVLAKLYLITGDQRYLEASQMFDNTVFFDGLAENRDTIQDRHANQHIPQIVGAVAEYASTGDVKYYNIAQHFWEMVTTRYAYSIGGVGTGERFQDPYMQGNYIEGNNSRGENCETCAAYNLLKVTKELYNYNPDDASYMDYYERTLLNQIAASQSHQVTNSMHNGTTYMLPIDPGQRKGYDSDYGGFTCCNGTGMENHVKYQEAAYAHTDDTLYVNLYMPTTVTWEEKGIAVKQETEFPSEHSKLTITGDAEFTMKIRVPYWATAGFTVSVNGEVVVAEATPSSYAAIERAWKTGDVVEINMPYTLHLDATPDKVDESTVASLMYGPIVMVAKDNRTSYVPMNWYNVALSDDLTQTVEIAVAADDAANDVPQLTTNGLQFFPMYDAYNYRYHVYVKVDEAGAELDYSKLQALVDAETGADAKDESIYAPKSFRAYKDALAAAIDLLGTGATAQSKINAALKDLNDAIDGLELWGDRVIDPNALEKSADIDYSFCSSWEDASKINDGSTGRGTPGNHRTGDGWGTWGSTTNGNDWIQYEWAVPVEIGKVEIMFYDNSIGGDGGVQVPRSYTFTYLDENGEWKEVTNAEGYTTEITEYNVTTFDTIKTKCIRVTAVKKGAGVGITEWKVMAPGTADTVDKTALVNAVASVLPESEAGKYTEESWADYQAAIAAAQAVIANEEATKEDVATALETLNAAEAALERFKPVGVAYNIAPEATAEASYSNSYCGGAGKVNDETLAQSGGRDSWNTWGGATYPVTISLTWKEARTLASTKVLWWSDNGGVPYPGAAELQYKDEAGQWQTISAIGVEHKENAYDGNNDVWNEVVFEEPITTTALQLVISAKEGAGATDGVGISEWEVYNYIVSEPIELPYEDVAEADWFYNAAYYAYIEDIMTGVDETTFAPGLEMTRAQLALMLYRLADKPEYTKEAQFPDLEAGAWYLDAVNWAVENGIISGYAHNGLFAPHDNVTREQAAVMLYNYAEYAGADTDAAADLSAYEDAADVSEWAKAAMQWAVGAGIITGRDGKLLAPQGTTSRAEGANIIYNYMN